MTNKILITGATGNLGSLVIESLLEKTTADNIAVMIRNEKDAERFSSLGINDIRIGNYDDKASMIKAFSGIDKLYFVSGSDLEARLVQHANVVNAAKEAKIFHIVYTSFSRKTDSENYPLLTLAKGHLITEEAIKNSGIPYTFLLNNYYMEVIPLFVGDVLKTKTIYFPASDGKSGFIARKDIAELSATILTVAGHENKIYEASGDYAYTFDEIAKLISKVSGTAINYTSPSEDDFEKTLKDNGVNQAGINISVLSARAIREGEFEKTSTTFESITGHPPISLTEFLEEKYGVKNQ